MSHPYIYVVITLLTAAAVAFLMTPLVNKLAHRINAIDIPKDERRMHRHPIPRLGGLAIFGGFITAVFVMWLLPDILVVDWTMVRLLGGTTMIIMLGLLDDVKPLPAWPKFLVQISAALLVVLGGVEIERFSNPFIEGAYVELGMWSIPLSVLWIVAMTNAINFIDGLDGLSVGVSSIGAMAIFIVAAMKGNWQIALLMAALTGGALGFLPFNLHPASMFAGDTGALFLGYMLGTVSIMGLFKLTAIVSFAVPLLILALPLFDLIFSSVRRIISGKSPMAADRNHIHHKLIDLGFSQRQSVAILYGVTAILSIAAVVLAVGDEMRALLFLLAISAVVGAIIWVVVTLSSAKKVIAEELNAQEESAEENA